ncbi:MAG: glycosyltransferase [Acidobacteriota bacterium]
MTTTSASLPLPLSPAAQRRGEEIASREDSWPWNPTFTPLAAEEAPDGGWPRISVVIPSYNQGAFLEEALRSLLLQGYPDLEILVLDGGSDDESVSILEHYDAHLSFWQSAPDEGQSDAINRGFERATGKTVTFFSSDDRYAPGTLAAVAHLAAAHPKAGVLAGAFRFIDGISATTSPLVLPRLPFYGKGRQRDSAGPVDLALVPPSDWRIHQVTCFYTAEALDAVGRRVEKELRYTMDRELLYRVLRAYPAAISEQHWADFRRHQESKSEADILPFAEEMAELQFLAVPEEETATHRHRRQRIANHRRARGRLKLARARSRAGEGLWRRCAPLLAAIKHQPGLLGSRGFLRHWARSLGLMAEAQSSLATRREQAT